MTEPSEYLTERIRARLADAPSVAELGIVVTLHGGRVFLNGCVHTPEHRDAIVAVAREVAAGFEVCPELDICPPVEPPAAESLSEQPEGHP
jgi:BON domain